ncbi:hypothetical protein FSARC_6557 [Fusarium sarcochroum]|uniref:Regulatory protein n=1 Tax=Fusarium sarcochroum TaxID=1208366 RepID=A0A8H4TX46_9HYPO|nr:hypothetical protein FSARC_6557 [Fusarium sarcochroum]
MRNVFRPSGHEALEYHSEPDNRIEEEQEEEEEEAEEIVRSEPQDLATHEQIGNGTASQAVLATYYPSLAARDEAIQPASPMASPNHITPWQRHLLDHFSEHIAPEMAVIDDHNNGWRNLVLPLACADELVMSAVMSVSAFHLAEKGINNKVVSASRHYSKAIRELRKRQDLQVYDVHERYRIILAIVVLLLAMIVNGSPDFPIMFRMLQSALDMVGGEDVLGFGSQMIAEFSAQQISK